MARVELALLPDAPAFGWTYQYQLPNDVLRVMSMEEKTTHFKIEGRTLLTDSATAKILYIKQVTDVSLYTPLFNELLSLPLAKDLSYNLVHSSQLKKTLMDELAVLLRDARSFDGQEGIIDQLEADVWLEARIQPTGDLGRNVKV